MANPAGAALDRSLGKARDFHRLGRLFPARHASSTLTMSNQKLSPAEVMHFTACLTAKEQY